MRIAPRQKTLGVRTKRATASAALTAAALVLVAVTGWTTGAALADGGGLASFLARSPGERGEAELAKTKAARLGDAAAPAAAPGDPEPVQRALGKIFDAPVESPLDALEEPALPVPVAQVVDAVPAPSGSTTSGGFPGASSGGFFPGGSSSGSGSSSSSGGSTSSGGGSTSGGGDTTSGGSTSSGGTTTSGGTVGAVPEPGTWMTMLLGMAMTGAALRSPRRRRGESAPCARGA